MITRRSFSILALAALTLSGTAFAQDANVIRAVTDATFPPMEFFKDGKRTGFDIELTEALAAAAGKKIEWTDIDFKGLVPGLVSKRFDIAVSAIYITPERAKVVDFTEPYYAGGIVVVTKDPEIKTLKDLDRKYVSVQVGTKSVSFVKEKYPQVQLMEVEKNQEMFNLAEIGRTAAAVTGKPAAKLFAQSHPGFRVLEEQISTENYGIAVRQDRPELTKELNAALAKIKADGSYDALVKKWFESPAQ